MTQTARVYGGSLYELAVEEKLVETIGEQMEEIRQTGGTSESQPGRLTVWFRKIIKKADEGIVDLFESLEEKNEEQATKE